MVGAMAPPSTVKKKIIFFFFWIREISIKSAKRNQVHMKYTRKASRKKKKTIQGNH
jgi:hypothetical protein